MIRRALLMAVLFACIPAFAQNSASIAQFFEGKQVVVKMDMPASQTGIDLYPERPTPIDLSSYSNRLKKFGVSLHNGDQVMITKVKVKDKNIEFQLAGGGYGTFMDESDSPVFVHSVDKSNREKDLENRLKHENDYFTRQQLKRELDRVRERRDDKDSQNRMLAQEASEAKAQRIDAKRVQGGSRFNIWYPGRVPAGLTAQQVMQQLSLYVSFPANSFPGSPSPAGDSDAGPNQETAAVPAQPGPLGQLRKGLTQEQVIDLLGPSTGTTQSRQNGLEMTASTFRYQDSTVETSFANGVLVKYSVTVN
ncbi:MAG: hypothetical protein WA708_09140 [Acidobacteriaceae bacterium]